MSHLHLHHLENSRSFRILWLLEELGLEYQLTSYERDPKTSLAPKSLKKIHASGKAPIVEVLDIDAVGDSKITTLIESGHIIDYLLAKYDTQHKLHPKVEADSQVWRDYDFWMHYAEGSIMPPLVMRLVFNKIVERSPTVVKPIANSIRKQVATLMLDDNINNALDLVETQLSINHWFAGSEFSAVDIQMAFTIAAANAGNQLNRVKYTNTLNWMKRCQARLAYAAAVQKGGKLEF